jgi:RNA polymerase sigma factor (TIGR02999 family)
MSEVTRILSSIESGDPTAAEQLLPLVYEELRKLAAARLAQEQPGQTLQATALVHEAYLRLVGSAERPPDSETKPPSQVSNSWIQGANPAFHSRGHFFGAAAEAMRRILVENARQKKSLKRGGDGERIELDFAKAGKDDRAFDLLDLNDALSELERHDAAAAQLVKLRYFAGFGHQEAAAAMEIGRREADRLWALARAWLYQRMGDTNS